MEAESYADPTWLPVEEGRREIVGSVLAAKILIGPSGSSYKMLVRVDREGGAERIWSTIPDSIVPYGSAGRLSDLHGKRVRLTVTIKRSDRDSTIGVGSRPTGAEIAGHRTMGTKDVTR